MKSPGYRLFGTVLISAALLNGCRQQQPISRPMPQAGIFNTAIFGEEGDHLPIVTSHAWVGNDVLFLIVPNFKRAGGGGGTHYSTELRFHGQMFLPDGITQVAYEAETIDGVVDSVTIDGQNYELKNGRVFFLSAEGRIDVQQLDHDPGGLPPQPQHNSKEYEMFVRSIPEFEAFMAARDRR